MIDSNILVTWRAWQVHNEVTHDNPISVIVCSKRFLEGMKQLFHVATHQTVEATIKGKKPVFITQLSSKRTKIPDKTWCKPHDGSVKLMIDGSFQEVDQTASIGMVLRDSGDFQFSLRAITRHPRAGRGQPSSHGID
jgi:hypothetical protein